MELVKKEFNLQNLIGCKVLVEPTHYPTPGNSKEKAAFSLESNEVVQADNSNLHLNDFTGGTFSLSYEEVSLSPSEVRQAVKEKLLADKRFSNVAPTRYALGTNSYFIFRKEPLKGGFSIHIAENWNASLRHGLQFRGFDTVAKNQFFAMDELKFLLNEVEAYSAAILGFRSIQKASTELRLITTNQADIA